ncbi:dioxygenase, partial [Pseudomonas viridiflava]
MRNLDEQTITQAVLTRNAGTENQRLHEIMTSLVQHLHAFARETNLTEEEWEKGIEFLTAIGHITTDKRQEFILLSDTLGLST